MATPALDAKRTFPGDQNPETQSIELSGPPGGGANAPTETILGYDDFEDGAPAADGFTGTGMGGPADDLPSVALKTVSPGAPAFRVVTHPDGTRRAVMSTEDETTDLGRVNVDPKDAEQILHVAGQYDADTESWDVDEKTVQSLMQGRLGLTDYVFARYKRGEVGAVRNAIGQKFLEGGITREDAIARGHEELLKVQVGKAPELAWNGGFGKFAAEALKRPVETLRFALGAAAEQIPVMVGAVKAGIEGAAKGMAATGAAAVATGTVLTPAGVAALPVGAEVGGAYGSWSYFVKTEAGSTAIDMLDKGFGDKEIRALAPYAGVIKGSLEMASFSVMTAPFKRGFISTVLNSAAVKKVLANGVVQYAKEIGAEITTEVAQTKVDQIVNDMAAVAENKPELLNKPEDAANELWNTALETVAATAVLGAPGAALDSVRTRAATKAEVKAQAETTAKIDAVKAKFKERGDAPAPVELKAEPVVEKAATPAPVAPAAPSPADLVSGFEDGSVSAEELITGVSDAIDEEFDAPPVVPEGSAEESMDVPGAGKKPKPALAHKAHAVAVEAAVTAKESDLSEIQTLLDEAVKERDRVIKEYSDAAVAKATKKNGAALSPAQIEAVRAEAGVPPTSMRDQKITSLITQAEGLMEDIAALKEPVAEVPRTAKLEMKAATLEDIIDAGFKEGGDEARAKAKIERDAAEEEFRAAKGELRAVAKAKLDAARERFDNLSDKVKSRPKIIKAIVDENNLTAADVKPLLKNTTVGLLGDVAFNNFVEKFKAQVAKVVERKAALADLEATQAKMELRKENYIRALNELPAVSKMTTEELRQYIDILETQYEKGDRALSPSLIEANKTGVYAGAKTYREVVAKAAARLNVTMDELKGMTELSELDIYTPLPHLAAKNPRHDYMVRTVDALKAKYGIKYTEFRNGLYKLGAAALASRPRTLADRFLAPTMPRVMAYLESESSPSKSRSAQVFLTPEELALAQYIEAFYDDAHAYLVLVESLDSRFAGKYAFHSKMELSEMLLGVKDKGVKAVGKEILENWMGEKATVTAKDPSGKVLGRRKFFKQTLFRSGELAPSLDVLRATDRYAKQFFSKQALDAAIPMIETTFEAVRHESDLTETSAKEAFGNAWAFVKDFLNTQKGQSILEKVVKQGGKIDGAIRLLSSYISFMYIAGNLKLQTISVVGETMAMIPAVGVRGVAKGQYQALFSKQGKAILAKYEHFTGTSLLKEVMQPGRNLEDNLGSLLYGIIQWGRHHSLQVALLASLTKEELASGTVSDERLADIKLKLGRWIDLPGNKSIFGSTSTGASITKFRGWAIPVMLSTGEDLMALGRTLTKLGDPKKRLTVEQAVELRRLMEAAAIALAVTALVKSDDEEDAGPVEKKLLQEVWTLLSALSPMTSLAFGPMIPFITNLGRNLSLLGTKYQAGEKEGEDRGVAALKKQLLTPALVKQILPED